MAIIKFTLEELLKVLTSNNLLPPQIVRTEVKNNSIHFAISTETFLLPFIPASLKFLSFENNIATLELNLVSGHFNKALGFFGQSYESRLPDYVKLELPNILIDLKKFFQAKKIKGVRVKEITQENDLFTIVAENV